MKLYKASAMAGYFSLLKAAEDLQTN